MTELAAKVDMVILEVMGVAESKKNWGFSVISCNRKSIPMT